MTPLFLRRAYFNLYVFSLLFRIPYWTLRYLLPPLRPRRSWSLQRCIQVQLLKNIIDQAYQSEPSVSGFPDHTELRISKGVEGLFVDGAPNLIKGNLKEWADHARVIPTRIPGYWIQRKGESTAADSKPKEDEKVLYFLHGGGYVGFSAHPDCPTSEFPKLLLRQLPDVKRSFAIEYRLTVSDGFPEKHPFPTQIIDALSGYNYLTNIVGFKAENIVVTGESAGGNLALALTRYLVENRTAYPELPNIPGALLLLSPWADLSGSNSGLGSSVQMFKDVDYLTFRKSVDEGEAPRALVSVHGSRLAWENHYISPACKNIVASFTGFPKTFIAAGGSEMLLDSIRLLHQRMVKDLGNEVVTYHEAEDSVHDYVLFEWQEPQRSETTMAMSKWISKL